MRYAIAYTCHRLNTHFSQTKLLGLGEKSCLGILYNFLLPSPVLVHCGPKKTKPPKTHHNSLNIEPISIIFCTLQEDIIMVTCLVKNAYVAIVHRDIIEFKREQEI